MIREYFDRYGPASLRDVMWWSGLSRLAVTTAMNESARRFVAVHVPWCQSPLYMYDDRHDQFQGVVSEPQVPSLNFLAHEDVALKAYFESRGRYLGKLSPRCAFNQIGEVLPTIMHGGQIIGTWAWDAGKMAVTYSIMRGYGSPKGRKEARRQAIALSETLRLQAQSAVADHSSLLQRDRTAIRYFQVRVSFKASFFLRASSMSISSRFAIAQR